MKKRKIVSVLCILALTLSAAGCSVWETTADSETSSDAEQTDAATDAAPSSDPTAESASDAPATDPTAESASDAPATDPDTDSQETESTVQEETETYTVPEPVGSEVDWSAIAAEMQSAADSLTDGSRDLQGMQFAILDCDQLVVDGISGQLPGQSFTEETPCNIASNSKIFAVAAVMRLVDQGLVDLDAPVTDYIPDFRMADERYKQITVRMLMNHSSGMLGNTCGNGSWSLGGFEDTSATEKFLEHLSTQRLRSDPGKLSCYCNDGFTLLQIMTERISGMPYAEYLRTYIYQPLDIAHTFSPQEGFDTSQLARSDFGGMGLLPPVTADPSHSGMFSTAADLCRFGKIFANGGSGVLSAESVDAMAAQEYKRGNWCEEGYSTTNYGLGWDAVDLYPFSEMGIKAVTKNGDIILSGSQLIVLPEYHLAAAAVGMGSSTSVLKNYLVYYLLRALQEKGVVDAMPERPALVEEGGSIPEELSAFEGTYVRAWGGFDIEFSGNEMIKTTLADGDKDTYRHIGNGHFTNDGSTDYWFFEQNGERYMVSRSWDGGDGFISLPNVLIQGNMVEKPALSPELQEIWGSRCNKDYLLVSEPYNSFAYVYPGFGLSIPNYRLSVETNPSYSSYWRGALILDESRCENRAEVPLFATANAVDATFTDVDGTEYVTLSSGMTYCAADHLPQLDTGAAIEVDGTAKWFRAGTDGTFTYEIDPACAVVVYTDQFKQRDNTVVTGQNTVSVQAGDYVGFVGNGSIKPVS